MMHRTEDHTGDLSDKPAIMLSTPGSREGGPIGTEITSMDDLVKPNQEFKPEVRTRKVMVNGRHVSSSFRNNNNGSPGKTYSPSKVKKSDNQVLFEL